MDDRSHDDHVSFDDLVRLEDGGLSPAERDELLDRISRSPRARSDLRRLRRVNAALRATRPGRSGSRRATPGNEPTDMPETPEPPPGELAEEAAARIRDRIRREVDRFVEGADPPRGPWDDDPDFDPDAPDPDAPDPEPEPSEPDEDHSSGGKGNAGGPRT